MLLLDFVARSLKVATNVEMRRLLSRVNAHFPTRGVVGLLLPSPGSGASSRWLSFEAEGIVLANAPSHHSLALSFGLENVVVVNAHDRGWSTEWLREYADQDYFSLDPTKPLLLAGVPYLRWSTAFERAQRDGELRYLRRARDHGIDGGVTVTGRNVFPGHMSLFAFLGPELGEVRRHQLMLRYLAPYLHEALRRAAVNGQAAPRTDGRPLTARELEVLNWAAAGKTNWEISEILHISERTVKFHMRNAMTRLQASSRVHAVAIALYRGLIEL